MSRELILLVDRWIGRPALPIIFHFFSFVVLLIVKDRMALILID